MRKTVNITLGEWIYGETKHYCDARDKNISFVIEEALEQYLSSKGVLSQDQGKTLPFGPGKPEQSKRGRGKSLKSAKLATQEKSDALKTSNG